ncbi:MAG: hypothetical protein QXO70_03545 [Candidatus Pacearchaeota archaeon]
MAKDIYSEPFLSYWPIPLSFKECFRSNKTTEKNLNLKKIQPKIILPAIRKK